MSEFTGERVIPGEVNPDLWAEHFSRYAFAARYVAGKHALDIGCGTGYGTAELAKHAAKVFGIDAAPDAVNYSRQHYPLPNIHFDVGSATSLPFPDRAFDVITAFEVIEHLDDWRALLLEAKRVMNASGILFISTPNKLYYAESREQQGPNPFHVHEFEAAEFQTVLEEFFPHVVLLLQNWNNAISVGAALQSNIASAHIESTHVVPHDAHFFLAMCTIEKHPDPPSFVYVPSASNVLRDREQHIRALDKELRGARSERDAMIATHAAQKLQLEESNAWARKADSDWKAALERVAATQDELKAAQARAIEVADAYATKVADLENENRQKTAWALEIERRLSAEVTAARNELAHTLQLLDRAEATVVQRTQWAQSAQAKVDQLEAQLKMIRDSRWLKLGRAVGLGPGIDG